MVKTKNPAKSIYSSDGFTGVGRPRCLWLSHEERESYIEEIDTV